MAMNTHDYENIGDDLFQMLCQGLIVREFPDVQCLPVGMPDGGRDATSGEAHFKNATIFQVKFCREPQKLKDPLKWVCDAIDGEAEKVERLAQRGASRYFLLTNVPGTSHLDGGTIDRVQTHLDATLGISGKCWWRDDLDRRLEHAFDLKLRYPGVINGTDLTRLVWEVATSGEDRSRRKSALNAYFGFHHSEDQTVRFRQIDLISTALLDLFIDVPAALAGNPAKNIKKASPKYRGTVQRSFRRLVDSGAAHEYIEIPDGTFLVRDHLGMLRQGMPGAADLLCDSDFAQAFPRVVLEGAPGQGKSTLTQYLAQLQRSRILERPDVPGYPEHHRHSPIALPFRLEFRDLAAWLKGVDPWDRGAQDSLHGKPKTLEGALAAHIERYSGGVRFDVADLNQVFSESPTLLLLDALDEVADLDERNAAVNAVTEALSRFEGNRASPQVIVTSRPTSIAGSPTFAVDEFFHLTLAPLDEPLALTYAAKWAAARGLDDIRSADLKHTLQEKLKASHIAQLAKNTMQLSILLNLVQRRGASLPDKRTELYNAYFDIFLDRESEKSPAVRDNRDLLVDIHRFLGFQLHSIAEQKKTSGTIRYDQLKRLLRNYLSREGQPYDLIDALLSGMVERFGALVSRVQGRYEFEVQPLQEYFAARHLNDTAPPSPTGRERAGTKSERFDAIAANPYWFNVTRFLAGSFNKGELADLADRLCDLINRESERERPYARSLAVALLQDWVFSQSPRATRRVVDAVFDDLGIAWAATTFLDSSGSRVSEILTLPAGAGAELVSEICWSRLESVTPPSNASLLCRLIRFNSDPETLSARWWTWFKASTPEDAGRRLKIGLWLGVPPQMSSEALNELCRQSDSPWRRWLPSFVLRGRANADMLQPSLARSLFSEWLNFPDPIYGINPSPTDSSWVISAWLLHPITLHAELHGYSPHSKWLAERFGEMAIERASPESRALLDGVIAFWQADFLERLHPWCDLLQVVEDLFGRSWAGQEIAILAAHIRNSGERGRGGERLMDSSVPLPIRARYAKSRRGDEAWWRAQLTDLDSSFDVGFWCLAVTILADSACLLAIAPELDEQLGHLQPFEKQILNDALIRAKQGAFRQTRAAPLWEPYLSLSDETLALISHRFQNGGGIGSALLTRMSSSNVAGVCMDWLASTKADSVDADSFVASVRRAYKHGGAAYLQDIRGDAARRHAISSQLLESPNELPIGFLGAATRAVQRRTAAYEPVLAIAAREEWFEVAADDF